ncbi:MFS transporter [Roseospira visakhapatnamensis]|uniref:Putative MFS family arabinose efflux permease n=1 Tax=Roseospira visakhapatnamensis TaxID=390880 RepID=A0A7W6RAH4_9PROT|nr:MFS transporter [Roseospira visakhapatnamensis]MBB4264747.1 putative MFS family arabinose efflux permease [Roseospira visakhapatnamensis]
MTQRPPGPASAPAPVRALSAIPEAGGGAATLAPGGAGTEAGASAGPGKAKAARTTLASRMLLVRLVPLTLVLLLGALATFSYIAVNAFEREILPEVDAKAQAVGQAVSETIGKAIGHGIPLGRLVGMGPFLTDVQRNNVGLAYLLVTDTNNQVRYATDDTPEGVLSTFDTISGGNDVTVAEGFARLQVDYRDTAIPIRAGPREAPHGYLHVGVDADYVTTQLMAIIYDILTVALVSLLVSFEFLLILVVVFVTSPMRQVEALMRRGQGGDFSVVLASTGGHGDEVKQLGRAYNAIVRRLGDAYHELLQDADEVRAAQFDSGAIRRIEDILGGLRRRFTIPTREFRRAAAPSSLLRVRVPLFLFIFAEEMTRPFLPLYVRELHTTTLWLDEALVLALPISVFMLAIAIITPFAGAWTDRLGTRRVFLIGAIPSVAGYLGAALAQGVPDLLVWRALSGFGYAVIYIACQGYVAIHADPGRRVSGMATFMGAVFAAAICGPSIGGILADRVGYAPTLVVSAGLVLVAAVLIHGLLSGTADHQDTERPPLRLRDMALVLRNGRLLALLLLSAIPAKILLTGFLFYLAPLFLTDLGESQSSVGRIIMVYGLMNVLVTPLAARVADRVGNLALLVGGGAVLSGVGTLAIILDQSAWMVALAVFTMGIAHALAISPQLVLVQEVCARECRELGQTTVLSVFRLIERLGNVAGPFLVGTLVTLYGYGDAMAVTGLGVMVAGAIYLGLRVMTDDSRHRTVAP